MREKENEEKLGKKREGEAGNRMKDGQKEERNEKREK